MANRSDITPVQSRKRATLDPSHVSVLITEDATVAKEAVGSSFSERVCVDVEKKRSMRQCEGGGFCTSISDSVFPLTNSSVSGAFEVARAQKSEAQRRHPRPFPRSFFWSRSRRRVALVQRSPSSYRHMFAFELSETTGCFFSRSERPLQSFHRLLSERETRRESQAELVFAQHDCARIDEYSRSSPESHV